jgi:hypothetical protein
MGSIEGRKSVVGRVAVKLVRMLAVTDCCESGAGGVYGMSRYFYGKMDSNHVSPGSCLFLAVRPLPPSRYLRSEWDKGAHVALKWPT